MKTIRDARAGDKVRVVKLHGEGGKRSEMPEQVTRLELSNFMVRVLSSVESWIWALHATRKSISASLHRSAIPLKLP